MLILLNAIFLLYSDQESPLSLIQIVHINKQLHTLAQGRHEHNLSSLNEVQFSNCLWTKNGLLQSVQKENNSLNNSGYLDAHLGKSLAKRVGFL